MSLNIAPPIPHNIVNAAAPSTEALTRSNAIKETVPAPVKAEAIVPQKSREADTRGPIVDNPTYDNVKKQSDVAVIPDDPLADPGQNNEQTSTRDDQGDTDNASIVDGDEGGPTESPISETNNTDPQQQTEDKKKAIEQEIERVEQKEIQQLERRDEEVRTHEQAHAAVGGGYAGTPKYQYETGPNGQKYAVSGEVSIDVSRGATPEDTIQKMQTVRAAALAPAEPSSQDRKVAAEASQKIVEARAALIREKTQVEPSSSSDASEETTDVNTDSLLAEEPSKRALKGLGEGQDDTANIEPNSMTLAHDNEQPVTNVIKSRYSQSYQSTSQSFNAVA